MICDGILLHLGSLLGTLAPAPLLSLHVNGGRFALQGLTFRKCLKLVLHTVGPLALLGQCLDSHQVLGSRGKFRKGDRILITAQHGVAVFVLLQNKPKQTKWRKWAELRKISASIEHEAKPLATCREVRRGGGASQYLEGEN